MVAAILLSPTPSVDFCFLVDFGTFVSMKSRRSSWRTPDMGKELVVLVYIGTRAIAKCMKTKKKSMEKKKKKSSCIF